MNISLNSIVRLFILFFLTFLVTACGDSGNQLSKGHKDAIKIQCEDSSDPKACGIEVRKILLKKAMSL